MRLPPRSDHSLPPNDLPPLLVGVPEHTMASDGANQGKSPGLPPSRIELSITVAHNDKQGIDLLNMLIDHIASKEQK